MNIYLVCEGPPDGLDVRVLNLVIAQKLGRGVLIEPAGGDRSLGSVADYDVCSLLLGQPVWRFSPLLRRFTD